MTALKTKKPIMFKFESRYPNAFKALTDALDDYKKEYALVGFNYNETAKHVIEQCNKCFDYVPNKQERITQFLQGLGLNIPYHTDEVYDLIYADGFLKRDDSESRHVKLLNGYWNFMAMRLIHISESKK